MPSADVSSVYTACHKEDLAKVHELLHAQADINDLKSCGFAPLTLAAGMGSLEILTLLAGRATEETLNHADATGESPLVAAALRGKKESVQIMLDAGADPTKKRNDDLSPRSCARTRGHFEVADMLEKASKPYIVSLHHRPVDEHGMTEIRCMSMGGVELRRLRIKAEKEHCGSMRRALLKNLEGQAPAWALMLTLPNGAICSTDYDSKTFAEFLSKAQAPTTKSGYQVPRPPTLTMPDMSLKELKARRAPAKRDVKSPALPDLNLSPNGGLVVHADVRDGAESAEVYPNTTGEDEQRT